MKHHLMPLLFCFLILSTSYAQDTVHVTLGWNIIGAVKAGAVPEVLITIPDSLITSSFFGYVPGVGYSPTDTLDEGLGYWVKARADGIIVFNTSPPIDSCKSRAFIYQGKFYHTVKIGNQCWMAENLDVGKMIGSLTNQTDNDTTEKFCYDNDPLNCALYGGMYQWHEAMQYNTTPGSQAICPAGWHIPTDAEFQSLSTAVGGDGNALKAMGQGVEGGAGTNTSGFSALLAGRNVYTSGGFTALGTHAFFWSSTENIVNDAFDMYLFPSSGTFYRTSDGTAYAFSVRCIED
jgi:uncharacterized protein (TIGR02145 family)